MSNARPGKTPGKQEFRISKKGLRLQRPDTGVGQIFLEEQVTEYLLGQISVCNKEYLKSFKYSLIMEEDPPSGNQSQGGIK